MPKSGIAIQYINRKKQTYYLYRRLSKTGEWQYHFSKKSNCPDPVGEIPEGYEIYEKVRGQVFLRRKRPRLITDQELALVRQVLDRLPHRPFFLLEEEGAAIIVHHAEDHREEEHFVRIVLCSPEELRRRKEAWLTYMPVMRFTLKRAVKDASARLFEVERYCYRGSVDGWISLSDPKSLAEMAAKYLPHIGRDSFYELSRW